MGESEEKAMSEPAAPKVCARCGQKIPSKSKLSAVEEGQLLCLACQIRAAQDRGLRH